MNACSGKFLPVVAAVLLVPVLLFCPTRSTAQIDTANVWVSIALPGGPHSVLDIAIDPYSPDTLYAATIPGTVYRSVDRSASWTQPDTTISDAVLCLAINPSNSRAVLAGTLNRGIFKTGDGGTSWDSVNVGLSVRKVNDLVFDPIDTARVYAGSANGLFTSTDGGTSWAAAGLSGTAVTDVALNPFKPDTIYAGTDGAGVYRSFDGGASLAQVNAGLGSLRIVALAVHPSCPDTIYAVTQNAGIYRSIDGATTWTAVTNGPIPSVMNAIAIAPSHPSVLYAGTGEGQTQKVFKSTDGGLTWWEITGNLSPSSGAVGAIAVHPDSANVVYAGLDAVYRLRQTGLDSVTVLAAGAGPGAPVAVDLNGDLQVDFALGNSGANTVSVYLSRSRGAVFSRMDYRAGSGPAAVVAADLDRDGDADLAVANRTKQTVSLLFNNGNGGFGAPVDLFTGDPAAFLAVADLDGDRDVDMAVGGEGSETVRVFLNDGRGSFGAPYLYPVSPDLSGLLARDFTGDGRPDLVVLSRSDATFTLLENLGAHTFEVQAPVATGPFPARLSAGDFDIDGDLDLAVSSADRRVWVFYNTGDGAFTLPIGYALSDTAASLTAADLDHDGYLDLLVSEGDGDITVLVNNGNGAFKTSLSLGRWPGAGAALAADLSGNGKQDVIVSRPDAGTVVLLANGVAASIKAPAPPWGLAAVDQQGDLGDRIVLTWKRPGVDETTGRIAAYRVMRGPARNGPYREIARIDTSAACTRDSTFVYRSFVDSNATVGRRLFYYVVSEDGTGELSSPSDTVDAVSRAQPFFDFLYSENIPFQIRDTIQVAVRLNPVGHDVQSFSLFLDYDTRAFRLLDRDASTAGVQPFAVDSALVPPARVLQNRVDPGGSGRLNYGLGFLPELGSDPVPVGSFRLVALRDTLTRIRVVSDASTNRQTALTDRADGALILPYIPPPSTLVLRYHRVRGSLAFQGRTEGLDIDVRFDLTQTDGSPLPDSLAYDPPNDADRNQRGVQMKLAPDGSFSLLQVPSGRYGLFVKAFHYLRARVFGDSIVVNDSLGVQTPVTFQWVSSDSSVVSPSLRAGDANDDNRVSLADFGILAASFGAVEFAEGSPAWQADFNGDGAVNLADFALLQSNFGEQGMGRGILTRPAAVETQVVLRWEGEGGTLRVLGARGMAGFAADLVLPAPVRCPLEPVGPGPFWQPAERRPLFLMRRIDRENETVFRLAAALPGRTGVWGDGDMLYLRLPDAGAQSQARLENVQVLQADGSVAFAGGGMPPVLERADAIPERAELLQNLPNPFNPVTTILFGVPDRSYVVLTIYSPLGQVVRTLVQNELEAGYHSVTWDGRDDVGRPVASGIYVYRLVTGHFVDVKKAVLLR